MPIHSIIDKTIEYLKIPSVVGHEDIFMDYLFEDYKKLGLHVFKYDGLIEIYGSQSEQAVICAHADRHGLISLGGNEFVYAAQYIREIKYGENHKSSRKEVQNIAARFEGESVYAYHPDTGQHLGTGYIETCYPDMRNDDALFVVQGTAPLDLNIPLAYASDAKFENDYLRGQIDNALSLGVIYQLFKAGYQGTALLSTEEEIGKSWLHIAAYLERSHIKTRALLVLDTSPYDDKQITEQGNIILRNRDKSEVFNAGLLEELKNRCRALNLPFRIKDEDLLARGRSTEDLGSTELGRLVQGTQGKWTGATVQIPTLMYHTCNEKTSSLAIENYFLFLKNILVEDPMPQLKTDIF